MKYLCIGRKDKISDLPNNIIENILERMPIRDAARTSTLSTKWRHIWTSISQLVLNNQFFGGTLKIKPIVSREHLCNVDKILLLHNGPIQIFILCIPHTEFDCSSDIDRWILFLSRNGIKNLALDNRHNNSYKLPSSIFSCKELANLEVVNCIFKPPHELRIFLNLIILRLTKVTFGHNGLMNLLSKCPLLQVLAIIDCSGIVYVNIRAPKLMRLSLHYNRTESITFTDIHDLVDFSVIMNTGITSVSFPGRPKPPNMVQFLGGMPRIVKLHLDGSFLKLLAAGGVPHRLPTKVNFLKSLELYNIRFSDLDHISSAICLIRSCPNMMQLFIMAFSIDWTLEEVVVKYLEARDCFDQMLTKLVSVKLRYVVGLKSELLFIKLLLAHSPVLETMFIELNGFVGVEEGFKISKHLARFPRMSPKAEIIC